MGPIKPGRAQAGQARRSRLRKRLSRRGMRLLLVIAVLPVAAGLAYIGAIRYFAWRESVSPSTSTVLALRDGSRLPLVQPTVQPWASASSPAQESTSSPQGSAGSTTAGEPSASGSGKPGSFLPPTKIQAPTIGLSWPVVLATTDHIPDYEAVGWMLGTGYPGLPGNMVLFGHLDGPNATFGRLKQLHAGDTFTVTTAAGEYRYSVNRVFETTPDDVAILAPTPGSTATLITCSGQWDSSARNYSRRLIVRAEYLPEVLEQAGER